MLISVCIPIMNRLDDLLEALPTMIVSANNSPPVEIVILDYNSDDPVEPHITDVAQDLRSENVLRCLRYEGRDHFHMAHARNLAMLAGKGEYLLVFSADIKMRLPYLETLREALSSGIPWVRHSDRFVGVVCVQRQEFIDAGGFDERFKWHGKGDKDLNARLERRGVPWVRIPDQLDLIYTPWPKKLANYGRPITRGEISRYAKRIWRENNERGVLVANEGQEWGQWTQ